MSILKLLRSALRGITANKLRSALTLLGVMIGVAAVILLLAVGNGSSQQINNLITQLGTKTITVRAGGGFGFRGDTATAGSSAKQLTLEVSNRLAAAGLGHVDKIVPQVTTSVTASSTAGSAPPPTTSPSPPRRSAAARRSPRRSPRARRRSR